MNIQKYRFRLWALSRFKIPMIGLCRPSLVELDGQKIVIKLPLYFFTKNHHGSMYFGAQAVGADLAAGYLGYALCEEQHLISGLVFKDFTAEFIKRPESDVHFVCVQGSDIKDQIYESLTTQSRITRAIDVEAYTRYYTSHQELVSKFTLGLSLKVKKRNGQ